MFFICSIRCVIPESAQRLSGTMNTALSDVLLGLHPRQPKVRNTLCWRHEQPRASDRRTPREGGVRLYGVDRLVFYLGFAEIADAIRFEKRFKRWRRDWKVRLIEEDNPHWDDLYLQNIAPGPVKRCSWVPDSRFATSGMTPKWVNRIW